MEIFVNTEKSQVGRDSNLLKVIDDLKLKTKLGIAVALNETVIPQTEWQQTKLKLSDKITIIEAIQGG